MRLYLIAVSLIFSSLSLSAQCTEYQSELQNVESYISATIKNLKKVEKATTLEEAQQYIDKAIAQTDLAVESAILVKEYASNCDCSDGINTATNIHDSAFDCRSRAEKAASSGLLEELKELVKKALLVAGTIKDEASEGTSYCLE